jgi:hypothetical protein
MKQESLKQKSHDRISQPMPLPMTGETSRRLKNIFDTGREDLSLAKICEAHWDAIGILSEANRNSSINELYGVWASEIPGNALQLSSSDNTLFLNGTKMFCSGAGIIDKALITAQLHEENVLLEINLKDNKNFFTIENDAWFTNAFMDTNTSTVIFKDFPIESSAMINSHNWYVTRKGFWMGSLGAAACWGGGAAGLLDYAMISKRRDPHTLAHLAAMSANVLSIETTLAAYGNAVDQQDLPVTELEILALQVRHLVEMNCTDILRRFARAYGPYPMACVKNISRRYQELDLFLRQNHAERDLESLGRAILKI